MRHEVVKTRTIIEETIAVIPSECRTPVQYTAEAMLTLLGEAAATDSKGAHVASEYVTGEVTEANEDRFCFVEENQLADKASAMMLKVIDQDIVLLPR